MTIKIMEKHLNVKPKKNHHRNTATSIKHSLEIVDAGAMYGYRTLGDKGEGFRMFMGTLQEFLDVNKLDIQSFEVKKGEVK